MDFLCLYLCARLLHRPLALWRGVLASTLGGVYAVVALLFTVDRVLGFVIDITVCLSLCAVAMATRHDRMRSLLRLSGVYLLISMLLGGIMTALFAQLNRIPGLFDHVGEEGISTWLFLAMAVLSALLTGQWGRMLRRATGLRRCTLIVEHGGRRAEISALVDSGNLLRDPISGRSVIPVDDRVLGGILPDALMRAAVASRLSEVAGALPEDIGRRVRLIPAHGATGERLLLGFLPEHVYIRMEGQLPEREVSALVAPTRLKDQKGEIAALVPCELMIE